MRQAGILAAAGIISLDHMIDRLAEDHHHARRLAEGLADIPGIVLDLAKVKTNMVFFDLADEVPYTPREIVDMMRKEANIWLGTNGPRSFRAVTHYWIGQDGVESFLAAIKQILLR
jgi:threonine aldolase